MAASYLNQGKTSIRDSLKSLVSHITLASDTTAFAATQTVVNPSGAGTVLTKSATKTDVGTDGFDATITVNGNTEFTNAQIGTIGTAKGTSVSGAGTDTLSRTVRSQTIGVQAGDLFTIGVRHVVQDNS